MAREEGRAKTRGTRTSATVSEI
uniref:Uncharacterized protein n=1 Tax=Arundo donax TaxID=35708 RepID=A0A0A8ZL31_ARUDO